MATKLKTRIDSKKLERAAYVLKAVAHPTRICIIDLLDQQKELSVSEIAELVDCEQSLLSHHLSNMRDKGILSVRREGKNMYYSLTDKTITKIVDCINNTNTF
jgi:DNA-binding transcriptional ArsR family regulator